VRAAAAAAAPLGSAEWADLAAAVDPRAIFARKTARPSNGPRLARISAIPGKHARIGVPGLRQNALPERKIKKKNNKKEKYHKRGDEQEEG